MTDCQRSPLDLLPLATESVTASGGVTSSHYVNYKFLTLNVLFSTRAKKNIWLNALRAFNQAGKNSNSRTKFIELHIISVTLKYSSIILGQFSMTMTGDMTIKPRISLWRQCMIHCICRRPTLFWFDGDHSGTTSQRLVWFKFPDSKLVGWKTLFL